MLKKFGLTIIVFLCIACVWCIYSKPIFTGYAKTFEVYLSNGSNKAPISQVGVIECTFINGKKGEACKISKNNFSLEEFLADFNAYVVDVEYTDDSVNYYAYSPRVRYLERIKGKKVNLHVSVGKGQITLGSPIIYGGY